MLCGEFVHPVLATNLDSYGVNPNQCHTGVFVVIKRRIASRSIHLDAYNNCMRERIGDGMTLNEVQKQRGATDTDLRVLTASSSVFV